MPIQLQNVSDRTRVVVVCDHCQRQITRADDGNYEFATSTPGTMQMPYFTHKMCSDPFRATRPGIDQSVELSSFPVFLVANLQLDYAQAVEAARDLAALG